MPKTMQLDIVSAEAKIYSGTIEMLAATGSMGELGIFPGHTALITTLKPGVIRVTLPGGNEEIFYVSSGILEVQPDTVTVLAETAARAADLDEVAALEAQSRAEKAVANKSAEIEYSSALGELAEAAAQLRAIQQLRKKVTK